MSEDDYDDKSEKLFDYLSEFNEKETEQMFNTLTNEEKIKMTEEYINALVFSCIDEIDDGRLVLLKCIASDDDKQFTLFNGHKYRLKLELDD